MGRHFTVFKLPNAHQVRISELLRKHRYGFIDTVRATLAGEGIEISRTSLWRYARRLKSEDAIAPNGANSTLAVILERRTGRAYQVHTAAAADAVISALSFLNPAALEHSEVPIFPPDTPQ